MPSLCCARLLAAVSHLIESDERAALGRNRHGLLNCTATQDHICRHSLKAHRCGTLNFCSETTSSLFPAPTLALLARRPEVHWLRHSTLCRRVRHMQRRRHPDRLLLRRLLLLFLIHFVSIFRFFCYGKTLHNTRSSHRRPIINLLLSFD